MNRAETMSRLRRAPVSIGTGRGEDLLDVIVAGSHAELEHHRMEGGADLDSQEFHY